MVPLAAIGSSRGGSRRQIALVGSLLFAASFAGTLLIHPWSDASISDLRVYAYYSQAMLHGHLPYGGFFFEYPPLAAPTLALGGIAGTSYAAYRETFTVMMLLTGMSLVLLTAETARRTDGNQLTAVVAAAITPLLLGAMLRTHFDLVPIALTMAALLLILAERPRAGFGVLGLAIAVKGFPLVVAVVAVAWLWRRAGRRPALESSLVLVGVVGASLIAGLAVSWHGTLHSLSYQITRPVEIESTSASGLYALAHLGFSFPRVVVAARSWGVFAPEASLVAGLLEVLGVVTVLFVTFRTARRPGPRELVLGSLAAVLVFMAFGKVLSPQYLIWAIPLLAVAVSWRYWALAATLSGAMILTFVEFPSHFAAVATEQSAWVAEVGVRNLLLIVAIWLSIRALCSERAPVPADQGSLRLVRRGIFAPSRIS